MRTKHLHVCVLIDLSIKVRLVPLNMFKPSSIFFLLTVQRRCFFCGSFVLFMFHVCLYYAVLSVPCSLVLTCWGRAGLSCHSLVCDVFFVVLSLSHMVTRVRLDT